SIVGRMIRGTASAAAPITDSYQGIVTRWDLMRVPADQGLMLGALTGGGVVLSLLFWAALPATTPHPHECCKPPDAKVEPPLKPLEALNENEARIASMLAQVEALEQKQTEEAAKEKGKGKAKGGKESVPPPAKKP
ncbi:MAG TPA: hypothetical protein VIR79_06975, partial [Nitrospira sp.]